MSDSIAALFQRLTQGVYVVGVAHGELRNAFTAAWVMQVSFDPLRLALSINPHHSSYRLLKEGQAFSVNVLKKGQLELAAHYGVGEEGHPDFHVVSACSGHGFKHAPAVGESDEGVGPQSNVGHIHLWRGPLSREVRLLGPAQL
jgi:flavin reductase (DIM6/NTAB) family NADH-FMN oxidoreductase RutF